MSGPALHRRLVSALLGLLAFASVSEAQSRPAMMAKSPSLAKSIPATNLIFYIEFDGLKAHSVAWKKSAIYKLLNETKLGAMTEDLAGQAIEQALATTPPAGRPKSSEVLVWLKSVANDGFAFGLLGSLKNDPPMFVLTVRNASKNGIKALFDSFDDPKKPARIERRGSRSLKFNPDPNSNDVFWLEGDDLVLMSSPAKVNPDGVIAAIEGKAPNVASNPIRVELAKIEAGFEPVLVAFVDFSKIPIPPSAARYGLNGLKRIDYRWGFQDDATYSILRVLAPSPRRGVLSWLEGPTFDKNSLPSIPAGLTSWTAFSFSPGMVWEKSLAMVREAMPPGGDPNMRSQMVVFDDQMRQVLGIRIKEDLLGQLGPKWVFYFDTEAIQKGDAKARAAITVELKDQAVLAQTLDRFVTIVDQGLKQQAQRNPRAAAAEFRKLTGATPGYKMILPAGQIPANLAATVNPTILVGKKQLVIGLNESQARAALAANRWVPGPDYKTPFAKLPADLIMLSVSDPRTSTPQMIASTPVLLASLNMVIASQAGGKPAFSLKIDPSKVPTAPEISQRLFPSTMAVSLDREGLKVVSRESIPSVSVAGGGVALGLLLPAVQAAREAARRSQCVNNLKQIGLALHNYHSASDGFPAAAITSKDGRPLLSWRVAILPYIEQNALYNEFKLDEAWDSPHNKALISKMPNTYLCPSRNKVEPFTTTYLTFVGGGALFNLNKPTSIRDVTDGTSNTMAVVESGKAIPWTKPDDITFDPNAPPSLLGVSANHTGGFNVLMTDGSVRFIKLTINPITFRALITRAGGEIIQGNSF